MAGNRVPILNIRSQPTSGHHDRVREFTANHYEICFERKIGVGLWINRDSCHPSCRVDQWLRRFAHLKTTWRPNDNLQISIKIIKSINRLAYKNGSKGMSTMQVMATKQFIWNDALWAISCFFACLRIFRGRNVLENAICHSYSLNLHPSTLISLCVLLEAYWEVTGRGEGIILAKIPLAYIFHLF